MTPTSFSDLPNDVIDIIYSFKHQLEFRSVMSQLQRNRLFVIKIMKSQYLNSVYSSTDNHYREKLKPYNAWYHTLYLSFTHLLMKDHIEKPQYDMRTIKRIYKKSSYLQHMSSIIHNSKATTIIGSRIMLDCSPDGNRCFFEPGVHGIWYTNKRNIHGLRKTHLRSLCRDNKLSIKSKDTKNVLIRKLLSL